MTHCITQLTYRALADGNTAISLGVAPNGRVGSTPDQLGEDVLQLNVTIRGSENLTIWDVQTAAFRRAKEILDAFLQEKDPSR
jgi:hypothetical protein